MEAIIAFLNNFLWPTLLSLSEMLLKIVVIILIIMISIEILKAIGFLKWFNKVVYFFTKHLGISENASFPLMVGVLIGITYGAGAILFSYKQGDMNKKDVILVSVFLLLCHAIFEDTLLFAAFGSLTWLVIIIKLFVASLLTFITHQIIKRKERFQVIPTTVNPTI